MSQGCSVISAAPGDTDDGEDARFYQDLVGSLEVIGLFFLFLFFIKSVKDPANFTWLLSLTLLPGC